SEQSGYHLKLLDGVTILLLRRERDAVLETCLRLDRRAATILAKESDGVGIGHVVVMALHPEAVGLEEVIPGACHGIPALVVMSCHGGELHHCASIIAGLEPVFA